MMTKMRKVLCLDWDKRSLRLVVARVGRGRVTLEDAHSKWFPNQVDADDPQVLGEFIRAVMRQFNLHHRTVVVDIPRERSVINRLTLPPTPSHEVAAAVQFQALKELPFPPETAAIDFLVLKRDERGWVTEVLLAAVTHETLDRVRATCAAAGLTPVRIGLRPYANMLSVLRARNAADRNVLLVDVGPGATEIDIIRGEVLAFARSANVNVPPPPGDWGAHEDSRIISIADIRDYGATDDALSNAVDELLKEVLRTLAAYRATEPEVALDEVIVAGGTGVEPELASRLEERLHVPVLLFDPTPTLGGVKDDTAGKAKKLRSFSATLGLAWGLSEEGLLALDFLNPKKPIPAGEALRKRMRLIGLAAAALLIAVGGLYARSYLELRQQFKQVDAQREALAADVRAKLELKHAADIAEDWGREAVWADELLNVVQVMLEPGAQPGERMVVQTIVLDSTARRPGIKLTNVHAVDWQVPREFEKRLNEARSEDNVRLYEAAQGVWSSLGDARKFFGRTDLNVTLRALEEFRAKEPQRNQLRRQELQQLRVLGPNGGQR
ncbi:MAG: pilus assembly protein PilM [Phycisphaerales bacterium]|nr:pilus assembly protein PilM [Phycisphaerales bacterium]